MLEDCEANRSLVFQRIVEELDKGGRQVLIHCPLPLIASRMLSPNDLPCDMHDRAFVVYPLREPSLMQFEEEEEDDDEKVGTGGGGRKKKGGTHNDLKSAEVEFLSLRKSKAFGRHQITLLHGKMTADEKSEAIASFRDGRTPAMVCTVVVEVSNSPSFSLLTQSDMT